MMEVLLRPKVLNIREGKAVTDRTQEKNGQNKIILEMKIISTWENRHYRE